MLAPITHILPLTTIRRERLLPAPGKVLARQGQKVGATDVVARANLNPEHLLLDISRGLGLSEEKSDQFIQYRAGEQVSEGDVLAGPVGMTKRVVRAPSDGRVIIAGGGQILLEVERAPFELIAGIPGVVTALIENRGVIIETTGALIQGIWGNGHVDYGLMYVLAEAADDILDIDRIDISFRGSIILGGYCTDAEVLKLAASLPLRGLILGCIDSSLIPLAARMPFPVIVIEGFGHLEMNSAAFKLLTTNERHDVVLNADPWDKYTSNRPEIIIPLPASGNPFLPSDSGVFSVGKQVRILRNPHLGQVGKIIDILPGMTALQSGVLASAANIELENGEKAVVPLANLDVLE
jgi:hypothetical protein